MDEVVVRQLIRQLRWLNFWVSFFGVLIIAALVVAGIFIWKTATYIHHVDQNIQSFQTKTSQTLNVQDQACSNSTIKSYLQRAGYCK